MSSDLERARSLCVYYRHQLQHNTGVRGLKRFFFPTGLAEQEKALEKAKQDYALAESWREASLAWASDEAFCGFTVWQFLPILIKEYIKILEKRRTAR